MAMDMTLDPTTTSLTIGDDYTNTNTVKFTIKLTGDGAVWLKLQIPVGENGVLRATEDANNIKISGVSSDSKSPDSPPDGVNSSNTKEWSLGDYQNGVQVTVETNLSISISNILCRANNVDSKITIIGTTNSNETIIKDLIDHEDETDAGTAGESESNTLLHRRAQLSDQRREGKAPLGLGGHD